MGADLRCREDRGDNPFDGGDEIVEGEVVAPVLDHVAGVADGRAVAAESLADILQRNPERNVADIHGNLADVAERTAAIAAKLHRCADEPGHFTRYAPDDAADRPDRKSGTWRQGGRCNL